MRGDRGDRTAGIKEPGGFAYAQSREMTTWRLPRGPLEHAQEVVRTEIGRRGKVREGQRVAEAFPHQGNRIAYARILTSRRCVQPPPAVVGDEVCGKELGGDIAVHGVGVLPGGGRERVQQGREQRVTGPSCRPGLVWALTRSTMSAGTCTCTLLIAADVV